MVTGSNTDVRFEGYVYHVQTEDLGLDKAEIVSLVYVGGQILKSFRAPYTDVARSGEEAIGEVTAEQQEPPRTRVVPEKRVPLSGYSESVLLHDPGVSTVEAASSVGVGDGDPLISSGPAL